MINGILLIYHHRMMKNAPMILDHVHAFPMHSRFKTWLVNTEGGFPVALGHLRFRIILLHYSLFGYWPCLQLSGKFLSYLGECKGSYKVAFFQDEYQFCQPRFDFINQFGIDCVYTLLTPDYFGDVYGKYTRARSVVYTIPGYVSDTLIEKSERYRKDPEKRKVDIGYRSRPVEYAMGKGAQEKVNIAHEFVARCSNLGLKLDIETDEERRLYGDQWYKFIADCRAFLGVEAGVSIFDLQDRVRKDCERMLFENPGLSVEAVLRQVLDPLEGNIYYRTISTRHFEAAAFKVCQILFEGKYSGIMEPLVHYLPLRKDFSNVGEVIRLFFDKKVSKELTDNAYRDLIASGKYSYKTFIEKFDYDLLAKGMDPEIDQKQGKSVSEALSRGRIQFHLRVFMKMLRYYPYPAKGRIGRSLKALALRYRCANQDRGGRRLDGVSDVLKKRQL
jgi:hypothetical protein